MAIELIDIIKPKNNGNFALADPNDFLGGLHVKSTLADRDNIPEQRRRDGMLCAVTEEGKTYRLVGGICNDNWEEFKSGGGFVVSPDEPEDKEILWIDNDDEGGSLGLNSEVADEFRKSIAETRELVDEIHYAITKELDPGYFKGKMPGEPDPEPETPEVEARVRKFKGFKSTISEEGNPGEEENPEEEEYKPNFDDVEMEEDYVPDLDNGASGTVNRIFVKRGLKEDLENLHNGEMGFCIDTEELYIGNKGMRKLLAKVGGVGGGGTGNVTGEYIDLIASDKSKHRVTINQDGDFACWPIEAYTAPDAEVDKSSIFLKKLMINHVYGGGGVGKNTAPCSHGFIEIYNKSAETFNLKGLSIQVGQSGADWQSLPLIGIIKPYHSFLIRCASHTDINRKRCRFKIKDYDMQWNIALSERCNKVYLCVGTEPCVYPNPSSHNGLTGTNGFAPGYIDLIGYADINDNMQIDAYENNTGEATFPRLASINHSILRHEFLDSNVSIDDLKNMDLRTADTRLAPKHSGYGQWTSYVGKMELNKTIPTMINMCFGESGDSTRTFTWQTVRVARGFFKYKKVSDKEFTVIETVREPICHPDVDATVHRVILKDLEPGDYVYCAGDEGGWTNERIFNVRGPISNSEEISILWTTDQQGLDSMEYSAWGKASRLIEKLENYDFHINTGDISNDGGEYSYQWRYYYDESREPLYTKVHMTCCGNNDLTIIEEGGKKVDPVAFTYYSTCENSFMPSCYSYNYGFVHFIALNSNTLCQWDGQKDPQIFHSQIEWMKADMKKPENQKRWTVVYMHESPYTIIKQSKLAMFIQAFYDLGVDLVICGHHHRYSRSHKIGLNDAVVPANEKGVYYFMSQATGYKLMGKTTAAEDAAAPWRAVWNAPAHPTYATLKITYNSIDYKAYRIENIMPLAQNAHRDAVRILHDEFVINK